MEITKLAFLLLFSTVVIGCHDDGQISADAPEKEEAAPAPSRPAGQVSLWDKPLETGERTQLCAVDVVNSAPMIDGFFLIESGRVVSFAGWISTPDLKSPREFSIVLQGPTSLEISGVADIERRDVVSAYSAPALLYSGYEVEAAASQLQLGEYTVSLVQSVGGKLVTCDVQGRLRVK